MTQTSPLLCFRVFLLQDHGFCCGKHDTFISCGCNHKGWCFFTRFWACPSSRTWLQTRTQAWSFVRFYRLFRSFSFFFVGFSFLITCSQGHFKFLPLVFSDIGAHWCHHPLQHWVELWWPRFNAIWVVHSFCFHHARCSVNGWNLFILSNHWWSLLLEC